MKKRLHLLGAALLILATVLPVAAQAAPTALPPRLNPGAQITAGQQLFTQKCSGCHGDAGQGRTAVPFLGGINVPAIRGRTEVEINNALATNPFMSSVNATITQPEVRAIAGFLAAAGLPRITLVQPANGQINPGVQNTIQATISSDSSVISSAEFQAFFADPPGTLTAAEIRTQSIISVPAPRAGIGAVLDTTPVPVRAPVGSVFSIVVTGTVTSVNPATGEWQIGTPPVFVYESAATTFQGTPAVGTAVRVDARRTLAVGPLVAREITQLAGGSLPASPARKDVSLLFNDIVEAVVLPVETAGTRLGGQKWRIGASEFLIDDPASPAAVAPGLGVGSGVTVRYKVLPAVSTGNTALEIFPQKSDVIPAPLHPNPVANADLLPVNPPAGSWVQFVVGGVVSAANPNGEWIIGNPPVAVYSSNVTTITGAVTVGSEVLVIGRRDLPASPIVADSIALVRPGTLQLAPPVVEKSFFVSGNVSAVGPSTWTVGGTSFIINDPQTPAVLGTGLGMGSAVTVEFKAASPPAPAPNLWAPIGLPFAFNAPSVSVSAVINPPAVAETRSGFLFVRATDGALQTNTIVLPATLGAVAAPPPPPVPVGGGGFGGGGGGAAPAPTVTLTGLTGTLTLNSSGAAQSATALTSTERSITVNIAAGTVLKTSTGSNLNTMTVEDVDVMPPAPEGKVIIVAHDFGPHGATFNPPIKLTLGYADTQIPSGVSEQSFVLVRWDGDRWLIETSTADAAANTVSADLAHFTIYGIMGDRPAPTTPPTTAAPTSPTTTVPPTTAAPTTPPTTAPPTTAAPTLTTRPPTTEPAPARGGTNWGVIIGIIAAALVVIAIAVFLLRRKPGTAA